MDTCYTRPCPSVSSPWRDLFLVKYFPGPYQKQETIDTMCIYVPMEGLPVMEVIDFLHVSKQNALLVLQAR